MTFTPDPEMSVRARNPARGPDGRLLSIRDAVEVAIFSPPWRGATGEHRAELERRRDTTIAELAETDAELGVIVERRRELVDRIRSCNLAIIGTGVLRDPQTGEIVQVLGSWRKRIPVDDSQPTDVAEPPTVVSGAVLADAAVELLAATGVPMTLAEIERLLRLQGLVPARRPSQTLANALRPAVRRGEISRPDRGWYELSR